MRLLLPRADYDGGGLNGIHAFALVDARPVERCSMTLVACSRRPTDGKVTRLRNGRANA